MKKFVLFLFTLVIGFAVFCGLYVKADPSPLTMTDGAQIRTSGEFQGLRFEAAASSLEGVDEHGFYLAAGTHGLSDMRTAIEANSATVGGNKLVKKSATGEDLEFAVTVYGMDDVSEYAQLITVVAYLKVGGTFTLDKAVTRNIADIAREDYNKTADPAEIISTVAEATRVKVTHSDSSVAYFGDTSEVTLAAGDTLDLTRGDYTNAFTINQSNVTLNGPFLNVGLNESGVRENDSIKGESTFSNRIQIAADVNDVIINGIKVDADYGIQLNDGDITGVKIKYCHISNTGYMGIRTISGASTGNYSNIDISSNYIYGHSASKYVIGINFARPVGNISICDNTICSSKAKADAFMANECAINLSKVTSDKYIEIKGNSIIYRRAENLISIGTGMEANSYKTYINIENNKLSNSNTTLLAGNGVLICGFTEKSSITYNHNYNAYLSPYFNALVIKKTVTNSAGDGYAANRTGNVKIDFLNNIFKSANTTADGFYCPSFRTEITSGTNRLATRIGFGVPCTSLVNISKNYYSSNTGSSVYTDNESNSNVQGCYYHKEEDDTKPAYATNSTNENSSNNGLKHDSAADADAALSAYETTASLISDFETTIAGLSNASTVSEVKAALTGAGFDIFDAGEETLVLTDAFAPYIILLMKHNISFTIADTAFTA